jgi:hypothetical protein
MRTKDIPGSNRSQPDGFALEVTVSLMILLTVVAVGLLGLSAVAIECVLEGRPWPGYF